MKKILLILMISAATVFLPKTSSAQLDPPPPPIDTSATPIDGGLSVLIGAGVLYGVKKYKDQRKREIKQVEK